MIRSEKFSLDVVLILIPTACSYHLSPFHVEGGEGPEFIVAAFRRLSLNLYGPPSERELQPDACLT